LISFRYILLARYADSRCDSGVAINEAFSFYAGGGVDVILGPCCDYAAAPVARQVSVSVGRSLVIRPTNQWSNSVIGSVGKQVRQVSVG